jgi:hypothetical protein
MITNICSTQPAWASSTSSSHLELPQLQQSKQPPPPGPSWWKGDCNTKSEQAAPTKVSGSLPISQALQHRSEVLVKKLMLSVGRSDHEEVRKRKEPAEKPLSILPSKPRPNGPTQRLSVNSTPIYICFPFDSADLLFSSLLHPWDCTLKALSCTVTFPPGSIL